MKQTYKQERKNSQQSISCSDPKMISAGLAYPIPLLVLSDDVGSTSRLLPAPDYSLTPLLNGLTLCLPTARVKPTPPSSSAWSSREPIAGQSAGWGQSSQGAMDTRVNIHKVIAATTKGRQYPANGSRIKHHLHEHLKGMPGSHQEVGGVQA